MKKLLFFILGLPALAFGQWSENFDAGTTLPAGWAVVNSGDSNGWEIKSPDSGTAQSGANVASILFSSVEAHNDYLITKAIDVQAGISDNFSFYIKSRSEDFPESYEVLLSTTDQTEPAFTTVLLPEENAQATWTKKTFSLAAYVGQTVYIAIHATDYEEWELYADTFVVNGSMPPDNDNCANPIPLAVGDSYSSGAITSTNLYATSDQTPQSCQTSAINNVWFSVVVPASGEITIETDEVFGSQFDDTVLNVFSGTCGSLVPVACNDNNPSNGSLFSKISLTGQTPGSTLLVSVWRWDGTPGGDGEFMISAYDESTLGTSETNANKNNINIYPNPVTDILNISDVSKVKSISISDVTGRVVRTIDVPTKTLNLEDLKSGMYLVTLNMKNGTKQTLKTIKK